MSTTANFREADLEDFKRVMAECRSNEFDTNWVLLRHVDDSPTEITIAAFGSGGVEELKSSLEDGSVMYGLVKLYEKFDGSMVDRFVHIHWVGKDVPFTSKGKYGVVHGSIKKEFIEPFHETIQTDNVDDLAEDILMSKITGTSGTKSMVLDSDVAAERKADRGFTDVGKGLNQGTPKETRGFSGMKKTSTATTLQIDEAVFRDAADVRNDSTATNWFVAGYENGDPKSPLISLGSGDDGFDGFKPLLTAKMAGYVLYRVTDVLDDNIDTVKFAYIQWLGERVKPLHKAKISTHRADLDQIFVPSHGTIFCTRDLDIEEIMDKIQSSSGSKSHVRNIEG